MLRVLQTQIPTLHPVLKARVLADSMPQVTDKVQRSRHALTAGSRWIHPANGSVSFRPGQKTSGKHTQRRAPPSHLIPYISPLFVGSAASNCSCRRTSQSLSLHLFSAAARMDFRAAAAFSALLLLCPAAAGRLLLPRKPDPKDAASTARWLAAENSWGVLSTISIDLGGAPFGNVVSFSDGLPGQGRGVPYFYLTALDPTARDAMKDARSSFTVSEFPIGTCGKRDPENPVCAKLTLTGKLKLVDSQSEEAEYARRALFSKHAEMPGWPKDHDFQVFKLEIESIFLIDWFGGAKPLSPAQYINHKMKQPLISLARSSSITDSQAS